MRIATAIQSRKAHLAAIVLVVCALYLWTLPFVFQYDDLQNFVENPGVRDIRLMYGPLADLKAVWPSVDISLIETMHRHYKVRAVPYLSFWLNYQMGGTESPWQWRIVNIALHALMCALLYMFTALMMRMPRMRGVLSDDGARMMALASAAIYAVHPLMTETVVYVTGRVGQWAAVFYLASAVLFMAARTGSVGRAGYAASLLCGLMAMFSKENAFTLPVMILAIEAALGEGEKFWDRGITPRWRWPAAYLALMTVIPAVKLASGDFESGTRLLTDMSRYDYLLTQFQVVLKYISLIFVPLGQTLEHPVEIVGSLFSARVFLPLTSLTLIGAAGVWMVWRREGLWVVAGLGILGFLITLAVESSVFPIILIISEYRTYLPMAFLVPGIVALGALAIRPPWARLAATVIALAVLSALTVAREGVWRTGDTLWDDVLAKNPRSVRALNAKGISMCKSNDYAKGIEYLERAVSESPWFFPSRLNLGQALIDTGRPAEAVPHLEAAARIRPRDEKAQLSLAYANFEMHNTVAARNALEMAITYAIAADSFNTIGALLLQDGQNERALWAFGEALRRDPALPTAAYNMGALYSNLGRQSDAVEAYQRALRIDPNYYYAAYELGKTYMEMGTLAEAQPYLERAATIDPLNADPMAALADLSLRMGNRAKARELARAAAALDPTNTEAREILKKAGR